MNSFSPQSRFQLYQKYFAGAALLLSLCSFVGLVLLSPAYLLVLLLCALAGYGPRNIFLGFVFWTLLFFQITPALCAGHLFVDGITCVPGFYYFGAMAYVWGIFSQVLGSVILWGILFAGLEWVIRFLVARRAKAKIGVSQVGFGRALLTSLGLGLLLYLAPGILHLFSF